MRKCLPLLVVLVACLGLTPASARAVRHGLFGFYRVDAYRLVFTEEQNAKMDAVLAAEGQDFLPLFKQRRAAQRRLADMLKSDAATDADIRGQVTVIGNIDYQIALRKAKLIRAIRKIATPEQLAKVDALEVKRAKRQKPRSGKAAPTVENAAPDASKN